MKSLMNRHLLWLSLVLLLGCLGYLFLRPSSTKVSSQESSNSIPVPSAQVNETAAQGSAKAREAARANAEGPSSRSDLSLANASDLLAGQVVSPSFEGIAETAIIIHTFDEAISQKNLHADQDGFFELPFPSRLPLSIEVSAHGFITRRLDFPEEDSLNENKIIMQPGGNLEILVQDENGQSIPEARIASTSEDRILTNRAGIAQLSKLRDPAQLFIQAEGFHDLRTTLELEPHFQTITLLRFGFLQGQVFDRETDLPIPEFSIKWQGLKRKRETRHVNHSQGQFEIDNLPRRKTSFTISASGYVSQVYQPNVIQPRGLNEPAEIFLEKEGLYFSGQVREKLGLPIAGATVIALIGDGIDGGKQPFNALPKKDKDRWVISEEIWVDHLETQSDSQGNFTLGPLPSNSYLGLLSYAPDFAPNQTLHLETLLLESRENIVVQLEKYGTLIGKAGQHTYPGTRVIAIRDASLRTTEIELKQGEVDFHLEQIFPGGATISFREGSGDHVATGEIPAIIPDQKTVQIKSEETAEVDIGFDEQFTLGGRILLDGHPMAKSPVVVVQKKLPQRYFRTQTDGNGYFSVHPVKSGEYEIMANGSSDEGIYGENNRKIIQLTASQTDLLFEFQSMGSVYGRVVSEPVGSQVVLEIAYPAGNRTIINSRKTAAVQAKGFFEFHQVPAGKFDLLLDTLSNTPQILVREQNMPADGSDVDLGDIGEKEGELFLNLSGPENFQQVQVVFTQKSLGEHQNRPSIIMAKLKPAHGEQHIMGLELGALGIETQAPRGFTVTPSKTEILIEKNVEHNLAFELQAHTYLEIRIFLANPLNAFKSAVLIQESNNREWQIPFQKFEPPLEEMPQGAPLLFLTSSLAFARDIPEGWWQLHITSDSSEKVAKRRFRLIKGQPIISSLRSDDFKLQ